MKRRLPSSFVILFSFLLGAFSLFFNSADPIQALSFPGPGAGHRLADAQADVPPPTNKSSGFPEDNSQGSWRSFTDNDLKAFINDIFSTAQEVRPGIQAAGLKQLASIMALLDSSRAVWVYDQAFEAAQLIPPGVNPGVRAQLEMEIIREESRLNLARAIDHVLILSPASADAAAETQLGNGRLALMALLARSIPPDDNDQLFQKLAPALAREDGQYEVTLSLVQFLQRDFPDRAQELFSEALSQFQLRPAQDTALRVFSSLTTTVADSSPALASTAIEVLLKKADELDQRSGADKAVMLPSDDVYGPAHLKIMSLLYPVMQKIDSSKARDWFAALHDRRNQQALMNANAAPGIQTTVQSGSSLNALPGSVKAPPPITPDRIGAGIHTRLGPATENPGMMSREPGRPGDPNSLNRPPNPANPLMVENLSRQPDSAFSQELSSRLSKAQETSRNNPAEFTRKVQDILPQIEGQRDVRAKAAALAQIALAFYQMNDPVQARQYLKESLSRSQQGDAPLLERSESPIDFFMIYCATSNVIQRLAPVFPKEAVQAIQTISDPQLRLRAMIDGIRFFYSLYQIKAAPPKQNLGASILPRIN